MAKGARLSNPDQEFPTLRDHTERSRRIAVEAVKKAQRVAEQARATRGLLAARAAQPGVEATRDKQIWTAAAAELARMTAERDRELGILAHELRQPLSAALAAEELVALSPDPATSARAHTVLGRQLRHLADLVNNLLEYSRLSLPAHVTTPVSVDLLDLVTAAIETVEPAAIERQLHVGLRSRPAGATVVGDPTRLRQALVNLLQNAVRYTPPGGRIDVDVVVAIDAVHVHVRDTGEGIAADQLTTIFEPFVRLSKAGPGLGIGLALVRRVAELHGGQVSAASDGAGRGSTFTLTLPLPAPAKDPE